MKYKHVTTNIACFMYTAYIQQSEEILAHTLTLKYLYLDAVVVSLLAIMTAAPVSIGTVVHW